MLLADEIIIEFSKKIPSIKMWLKKIELSKDNYSTLSSTYKFKINRLGKSLEKFIDYCKQADMSICSVQRWFDDELKENFIRMTTNEQKSLPNEVRLMVNSKQNELAKIEKRYGKLFNAMGFKEAANRVEFKCQYLKNSIKELIKQINNFPGKENSTLPVKCSAINIDHELSNLEKELADLGVNINGIEITFQDIDTNVSNILTEVISIKCAEFKNRLDELEERINKLKQTANLSNHSALDRWNNLNTTQKALCNSLKLRMNVLIELKQYCTDIYKHLLSIESELPETNSNVPKQIRENCIKTMAYICETKEKLDMFCIQNSDLFIGIEEVTTFFDDWITLVDENFNIEYVQMDEAAKKTFENLDIIIEEQCQPLNGDSEIIIDDDLNQNDDENAFSIETELNKKIEDSELLMEPNDALNNCNKELDSIIDSVVKCKQLNDERMEENTDKLLFKLDNLSDDNNDQLGYKQFVINLCSYSFNSNISMIKCLLQSLKVENIPEPSIINNEINCIFYHLLSKIFTFKKFANIHNVIIEFFHSTFLMHGLFLPLDDNNQIKCSKHLADDNCNEKINLKQTSLLLNIEQNFHNYQPLINDWNFNYGNIIKYLLINTGLNDTTIMPIRNSQSLLTEIENAWDQSQCQLMHYLNETDFMNLHLINQCVQLQYLCDNIARLLKVILR